MPASCDALAVVAPCWLDEKREAMIGRAEILRVANSLGLEPRVIEKDYVFDPFSCRYLAEKPSVRGSISGQFGLGGG